jgi:transposase
MVLTEEVAVRPPEVFVRELTPQEGARLKSISRRAKYQSKRERAMILLASSTGMSAPQIAGLVRTDESHVRKVIHAFNDRGFDSLDPDYRGGRPRKTTPEQRDRIVAVARARPDTQGVPLTRWSLPKLQLHLAGMGVLLSEETLRQTLIDAGPSHQRTRSWKWSPDPDFAPKAERVLGLYRAKPKDGVVVCFDEMGPIQLIPHHGSGWAPAKRPERRRATYSKKHGVRYLFGAYDVHADRLHGRLRAHKNAGEVLAFYRQIRMRYDPRLRIYLIADNLSTPQDPGDPRMGRRLQRRTRLHPDLRQLPEPHRVPLLGNRRVRGQERRLPRLGHARQGDGRPHPLPQRPPPRPTPDQGRTPSAHRRVTDAVSGQTILGDPTSASRLRMVTGMTVRTDHA